MRFLLTLTMLTWALPAFAQQQPNAETLFRTMEKQVQEAQGLKVGFEMDFDFGKDKEKDGGKLRGTLQVMSGNKARVDVAGVMGGKEVTALMVADGVKALYRETPPPPKPLDAKSVEPNLSLALVQSLARGGVFAALDKSPNDGFDLEKSIQIEGFKLGEKEKVGARDTQPVECQIKLKDGKLLQMTTWLDTQTNFPLKRRLTAEMPDKKSVVTITEVYTEVTLNPKLDPKVFDLPKR